MYLKQHGEVIYFGTDTHRFELSTARIGHFTRDDVAEAETALIAAYPAQADEITRLADRLRRMV